MSEEKKNTTAELTDEQLEQAAGGVQAGSILKGGEGEFGEHSPERMRAEREKEREARKRASRVFL